VHASEFGEVWEGTRLEFMGGGGYKSIHGDVILFSRYDVDGIIRIKM